MTTERASAIRVTSLSARAEATKAPIGPGDTLICAEHVAALKGDWAKTETQLCAVLRRRA